MEVYSIIFGSPDRTIGLASFMLIAVNGGLA